MWRFWRLWYDFLCLGVVGHRPIRLRMPGCSNACTACARCGRCWHVVA